MDIEELDEWLGPDTDGEDPSSSEGAETSRLTSGAWDRPGQRPADLVTDEGRRGGRRRWLVIAGAAAMLWLTVMLLLTGSGGDDEASPGTAAADDLSLLNDAQPAPVTAPPSPLPADDAAGDVVSPPHADDETPPDAAAGAVGAGGRGGGLAESGAILALRQALLDTSDDQDRYLEWAVPVQRTPLADEVDLVVLDAVWLQGSDGVYDTAERGYWAVPVTLDGTVLAAPWAVNGGDPQSPPDPVVPLLRQRIDEVEQALDVAGWSGVVVQASEAHPDLRGTWLALVDGVDPAGVSRAGVIVWLHDEDPMTVRGLDRQGLDRLRITGLGGQS